MRCSRCSSDAMMIQQRSENDLRVRLELVSVANSVNTGAIGDPHRGSCRQP